MTLSGIFNQLEVVGITIRGNTKYGYPFIFDGDERDFMASLIEFMANTDYIKQDDDWFPGDPGDTGEQSYYLMDEDSMFCISFDDKIMSRVV